MTWAYQKGDCHKPEYKIWAGMLQRCRNRKSPTWKHYGGRGIRVRFKSFQEFFAEVGPRPSSKHSIDRFPNNDRHYEPGNVRWATAKQQASNKRKPTLRCVLGGRCNRGHKLTEVNSFVNKKGSRVCYQCVDQKLDEDNVTRAAKRYLERFGSIFMLQGIPPLIPHDCDLPKKHYRRRPAGYYPKRTSRRRARKEESWQQLSKRIRAEAKRLRASMAAADQKAALLLAQKAAEIQGDGYKGRPDPQHFSSSA